MQRLPCAGNEGFLRFFVFLDAQKSTSIHGAQLFSDAPPSLDPAGDGEQIPVLYNVQELN